MNCCFYASLAPRAGFLSLPMTLLGVIREDFTEVSFFQGYNGLTVVIVMLQVREFIRA